MEEEEKQSDLPVLEIIPERSTWPRAAGLAFLFGLGGVLVWVLAGLAGWILSISAILIAVGVKLGYDKGKGPKKLRIITLLLIYFVQVFLSIWLMCWVLWAGDGATLFGTLEILMTPEVLEYIAEDLIYIGAFALVGLAYLFIGKFGSQADGQNAVGGSTARPGKRFEKTVPFTGDFAALLPRLEEILTANKFKAAKYGEEEAYRKGDGFWAVGQVMKIEQADGGVKITAFVLLNNGFGVLQEAALDGFVGAVPKSALKKVVEKITAQIETY